MEQATYRDLMHRLSEVWAVKKTLTRNLPPDLPAGSASVLGLLSRHGEMTISELTDLLAIDISVTSRHVSYLADHGWLDRSPNPADGRSRLLRLTDSGHDLLTGFADQSTELLAERLGGWSDEDVHELIRLMHKLHDSLVCPAHPLTHVRS
ncbi:MarR family winged helix-turn-helix transcriptional regulator [Nocardioides sp. NPDC057772]|uniref:MarR family winged helix-turn-helix transcriptional regulator n=1 Tax=Nocardioides sp. NPDC057772 TaxID=3346245 RepID=UPI00366F3D71